MKRIKNLMKTVFVFVLILGMAMCQTEVSSLAYTVEFTHDGYQYVLPGDSEVELAHILDTVGLSGEVTDDPGTETMTWTVLQTLLDQGGTVTLIDDVTAGEGDSALVIPENTTVTLDLNGHTIDRGLKDKTAIEDGNVITVLGNLTLTDSSTEKTGKLTGGNTTGNGGGVYVAQDGTFTMEGGKIDLCTATGENSDGGGVYNYGAFTMEGGTISDCTATGGCAATGDYSQGGGVYVGQNGAFTMEGGKIDHCTATGLDSDGGGVYVGGGIFNMSDGTITGCSATHDGGGVYFGGGMFNMSDGTISGCSAAKGGGVYNNGTFNMEDGTIDSCDAEEGVGGGVYNNGEFTMEGGTIDSCDAEEGVGGGVYNNGEFTMEGGTIDRCTATNDGGGVYNDGTFTIEGGTITGCTATVDNSFGGGVYNYGEFTMEDGTITGCSAYDGGGVYVTEGGTFTMEGGTIDSCTATNYGGGVYNDGTFTIEGGTITGCSAYDGGGVYNYRDFTIEGGTITGCTATNAGGGVHVNECGTFTMEGGTITGCSAYDGGGVYNDGTFTMSGAPVIRDNKKDNSDNSANNVVLNDSNTITVIGTLTDGAELHINADKGTTVAQIGGSRTNALTETEAGFFKSDVDSNLLGGLNDAGQVVFKAPLPALTGAADLTYNGTEQTPALTFSGNPAPALTAGTDYTVSYKKVNGSTETVINGVPKDAGDYKAVVTGTGSYTGTSEASFTINRKEVTVSSGIAANDKTYDRTTAATLYSTEATVFDGKCDGDSLTVSGTGSFEDSSAGSGKTVTIDLSSLTLGGTSSANYVLASGGNQTQTTATINKASITIKAADKSIYVGNTVPSFDSPVLGKDYIVTGLVGSDQLATAPTLAYSATPDNTKAGRYTITPGGAAVPTGGNYADDIVYQTGTLTIKVKSGGGSGSGGSGSGSDPGTPAASPAPGASPAPSAAPEASPAPSTAPEASPAPSAAPGTSSAPTIVEQKTETTQNTDGSTTTTTTTIDSVGTQKTESETVKPDGTVEKSTETIKADGTTEKSTEKIKPNGSSEKQTEIVSADGSTEKITEKIKANGSSEKVTDIEKANGATIHEEVKTTAKGKETSQKIETSASGSVKITEQVKQPSGDHSKVVMNKTGKNSVAIKQAVTTAKNGKISIPKTVNANGEKLKVTALKKNFLKGSETKPKKITINAPDITKIAKGAFNGIAKKATIGVKAGKKDYKRIKSLIKNSGVGKDIKIKRVK